MFGAPIQRWSCKDCGFKFSDPNDVKRTKKAYQKAQVLEAKMLKTNQDIPIGCQICVTKETSKNLASAEHTGLLTVPQKREFDLQDLRGAVVEFLFWMQKEGRAKDTYDPYCYSLEFLIKNGANLFDPESVKKVISKLDKTKGRKYNLMKAYRAFLNAYGIKATLPKYVPDRKLPYLPPEEHMDQLIASCNQEMAAFLQTTKETAARPCETLRILPDELDFINKKIPINHPAKGCNPRVLDMSSKLYTMLRNLPKDGRKKVFAYKNSASAGKTFRVMRKRAIRKLGIPELKKIHIYTFRYWRATVEFQQYQTEAAVMVLLGHKSTRYLWLYVQLAKIYFGGPRKYIHLWVYNREQENNAVDQGFEYIRTDKDGASLYRKPK
jgi:integrase